MNSVVGLVFHYKFSSFAGFISLFYPYQIVMPKHKSSVRMALGIFNRKIFGWSLWKCHKYWHFLYWCGQKLWILIYTKRKQTKFFCIFVIDFLIIVFSCIYWNKIIFKWAFCCRNINEVLEKNYLFSRAVFNSPIPLISMSWCEYTE